MKVLLSACASMIVIVSLASLSSMAVPVARLSQNAGAIHKIKRGQCARATSLPSPTLLERYWPDHEVEVVHDVDGKHVYTVPESDGLGIGLAAGILVDRDVKSTTSETAAIVANVDVGTETSQTKPAVVVHHHEFDRPYYVKPAAADHSSSLLNVTAVVDDTSPIS